ncbi:hypothetical protein, partial [Chitiniphilus shinanonensis]
TRSVYSKDGRLRFSIDAAGYVTENKYDANGRIVQSTRYANAVSLAGSPTEAQVRAALVPVAADQQLWQVYDAGGNLRFSINDAGYVKENRYDALGQVTANIEYAIPVAVSATASEAAMVAALAAQQSDSNRRITGYVYDNVGRTLSQTDALGQTQKWTYDALGNKTSWTNAANLQWTYAYDAAGRLVLEKTPALAYSRLAETPASPLTTLELGGVIQTRYTYDALGNVLSKIEADGLPETRTTEYRYDALGRQTQTIHPQVEVWNNLGQLVSASKPTETVVYDALGRVVIKVDTAGKASQVVYNPAGQVAYEIDANGYVTSYGYDAFGNRTRVTRHANYYRAPSASVPETLAQLNTAFSTGGNKLNAEDDRTITYGYDQLNRQVMQSDPTTGYVNGANGVSYLGYKRTLQAYDAFGHVVDKKVLGMVLNNGTEYCLNGLVSVFYYDGLGRQIARIDRGVYDSNNYLTEMQYDAAGNLIRRIEYANIATNVTQSGYTKGAAALASAGAVSSAGFDREVSYTYDLLGRKTSETQYRVQGYTPNGNAVNATLTDLTTTYRYDALGNLIYTQDGLGNQSYAWYDALGRTQAVLDVARVVDGGAIQRPLTIFFRDVYGNVVKQQRYASGGTVAANGTLVIPPVNAESANDQIEYTQYDAHGRAIRQVNAVGDNQYSRYDAAGRVAYEWITANGLNPTGSRQQVRGYEYDATGRQTATLQQTYTYNTGSGTGLNTTQLIQYAGYNAFGEIVSKGDSYFGNGWEVFHYNRAGQLIADYQGGVAHAYRYDAFGNLTLQIESDSRNLLDATFLSYRNTPSLDMTGAVATRMAYDPLGRNIQTWQASRTLGDTSVASIRTSYNRWGDKTSETGYDGATFSYTYRGNQLAQVIYQGNGLAASDVTNTFYSATLATNGTQWVVSSGTLVGKVLAESYYDGLGRKVGERDANGNLIAYHYDAAGNLIKEDRAAGAADFVYTYDLFGRRVSESGNTGYTTATRFTYDQANRRTAALIGSRTLSYTYNALNQLVYQSTRFSGGAALGEAYAYDDFGRVVSYNSDANNYIQTYSYDSRGNKIADIKTSRSNSNQKLSLRWNYDYFGRLLNRTDLGNNTYAYLYDRRGRMVEERAQMHLSTDTAGTGAIDSGFTHWLFYAYDDQGRMIAQVDYSRLDLDDRRPNIDAPWTVMDGYTRNGTTTGYVPAVYNEGVLVPGTGTTVSLPEYDTYERITAGSMPKRADDNVATTNVNEFNQFALNLARYLDNPATYANYFNSYRAPDSFWVSKQVSYSYTVQVPQNNTETAVTGQTPIYNNEGQVIGYTPVYGTINYTTYTPQTVNQSQTVNYVATRNY